MKINFLLGSGLSIPAKLPSIGAITQRILSSERIKKTSGDSYSLDEQWDCPMDASDKELSRVELLPMLNLLDCLKRYALRRFERTGNRETNYEDLAYLAGQIHDDILGNRENSALQPFIESVIQHLESVHPKMAVSNHDVVLVPKGHHPCGAPHGYAMYYLNVMAGPLRKWRFKNHPDHDWIAKRDAG